MIEIKNRNEMFFENTLGVVIDNSYDPYTLYVYKQYVNEYNIQYLISQDNDLSYLRLFPNVQYISINEESENLDVLYTLHELKGIKIYSNILNKINLSLFLKLEYVFVIINEELNFENILNIKHLYIRFFNDKSIKKICNINGLKTLTLDYCRKLENLNGIEQLDKLENLSIDYCQKLKSVYSITKNKSLNKLEIMDSNSIDDIEETLSALINLEALKISSETFYRKKYFNNLNFISSLKKLKKFHTDYIIKDGNLTPLMKLDDTIILTWKKYYNLKDKDLPHREVLYRIDNNGNFVTKELNKIENGKENKNIIWLDSLRDN